MPYFDPDFNFLFLKAGWQAARKQTLRTPLPPEWKDTIIEWVQQATVSEALRSYLAQLQPYGDSEKLDPEVAFAASKTRLLALLTKGSKKGLTRQLATLQFYRHYLAVFPELFLKPLPDLSFSEALVNVLRQKPLDLRQELYFTGPTVAYELEPDFFYYAVSPQYASELVRHLPAALQEQAPPDVDLFLSLAQACAVGEVEMLVLDK